MAVTFKSPATGNLIMLQVHAKALLHLIGKSEEQGIIQVDEMPAVLDALRALPDDVAAEEHEHEADHDDKGEQDERSQEPPQHATDRISLHKRAWPLIQMIERAQSAGKPIVWGV